MCRSDCGDASGWCDLPRVLGALGAVLGLAMVIRASAGSGWMMRVGSMPPAVVVWRGRGAGAGGEAGELGEVVGDAGHCSSFRLAARIAAFACAMCWLTRSGVATVRA